jgi:ABC-type dipeptide/oligopeptide/nickel transport system ATPase component
MKWKTIADHPAVYLILGDVGTGKTVTACSIMDEFHGDRKSLKFYMIDTKDVVANYPKWIRYADPKKPRLSQNSVIFLDDAHLHHYARDWFGGKSKRIDWIARERRQSGNTIIYTTQQSRVLDINLISMASCLVFKRPSKLQLEVERKEIKKMYDIADKALKEENYKVNKAYVVSNNYEGIVTVKKPKWFTDKISKAHTSVFNPKTEVNPKQYVKPILKIMKQLGRLA